MKFRKAFNFKTILLFSLFLMLQLVPSAKASITSGVIEEYLDLPEGSSPGGLLGGFEQNIWITGLNSASLYHVNQFSEYGEISLNEQSQPFDMLIGTDLNLWVTDPGNGILYQIDPIQNEVIVTYPVQNGEEFKPTELMINRDERIFFTDFDHHSVGRLTRDGLIETIGLDDGTYPLGITSDNNGNIWFTAWGSKKIGKLSASNDQLEYITLPQGSYRPSEIIRDPSGSLWFIYDTGKTITHIDPINGEIISSLVPSTSDAFMDISIGEDGNLWFLGTNGVGFCEISHSELINCTETTFVSPIFEGDGRSQIISGGDGYLYFTRMDQDKVFRIESTAQVLQDLQITFSKMTDFVLYGGEFSSRIRITNFSHLDAPSAQLVINLDEQLFFDSIDEINAQDCTQNGDQIICELGMVPAGSWKEFEVNFHTSLSGISGIEKTILFEIQQGTMDYLPINNQIQRSFKVLSKFEYWNDFSEQAEDDLWSQTDINQPISGLSYLGEFANNNVYLEFYNLPHHDEIKNCYQLYINGSWDGKQFVDPTNPEEILGPDIWAYYIDENAILVTTFSNQPEFKQDFPNGYRSGNFQAQAGAREIGDFDGDGIKNDARYDFCFTFPHQENSLKLTYYGVNLDGEYWGIDNVLVEIYYHDAFQWLYLPLIMR